jgi:hypothetical protein
MIKEMRAEMRRLAYMQIKTMVVERVEEQEREAARVQLEILAHGMVTQAAQAFFERLPKVDELIKPISASDVYRLLEGAPAPERRLFEWDKKKLPEYQPDLGKGEDDGDDAS